MFPCDHQHLVQPGGRGFTHHRLYVQRPSSKKKRQPSDSKLKCLKNKQTNKKTKKNYINETNYPYSGEIRRLGRGRPSMHRQERPLKTQREPTARKRNGGELLMFSVPCFIHRRLSDDSSSSSATI